MILLAIDTAANLCATCLYDTGAGRSFARREADIGTGHAELLMDQVADCLNEAGVAYGGLGRVGVSVGPGSFTGVRIGVAAARGLALALKIPAVGVSTLAALAHDARRVHETRPVLSVIDAKRDQFYVALHDADGREAVSPFIATLDEARGLARSDETVLTGSGAELVAGGRTLTIASHARTAPVGAYARLAALAAPPFERPKPLYLRTADAKPQEGFALPRRTVGA
ncbi:MAG: tRNA (adenosine(37)-N6)-threonylcarbamoyltransferase complex dimerization subunit type 1 TsaB [Rhizobiaceae bacterium]|nr:tRNA (adenosine(37)-N6)-threonylcarbamoyltransferase complex dimerization subunit type 1 TsaB [Rhizobiaceae bacterium]MCV0405782.1 tRNA (adenosine(37)-N6)-threonylcarbamoyltransferase complex dimerization subunit type 1 TsaB [Rhizobiaceae bacterium]